MSVRTDTVNLIVNVNGNQAQNNLNTLRKKAADISFEMKGLSKGTAEYIAKGKELKEVTGQMDVLKKQIGITALSQKELNAELNKLKALRGSVVPFSNEYKELGKSIGQVEKRLYDVKNGTQGFASYLGKLNDAVKQFGVVAAAYLGFQFITSQFQNIIKGAGKLSDQLADLRRVAGLTAEEAGNLNSKFKELNTRTTTEGLREIAILAGKLGVAKDDVFDFTAAVDKLVVSLGDELGNADQITTQLGKILNIFNGEISADGITKLGNTFVELANTGASTGGFIADFDQRLSGIAKSAGISLGALSGLGAGLEEMGGRVESSATAIQQLVISIAADIPKAAKIAGQSTAEFNKLFKLDPTEALLKYSEGLVKNKASFAEVTASLKDAGEEGARSIEVISKLGAGADQLRKRIDLGKESIERSSAITEAFALKNETFGATLDKLGKEFNKLISSPALNNFLQSAAQGALNFIQVLKAIPKFIDDNSTALKLLALGIALLNISYIKSAAVIVINTAAKIQNAIATRAIAIATTLAEVAQASYIVVTNLLTGRIGLAIAAQRLWAIALSVGLGPLGIIISLVGAAVVAYNVFTGASNRAATSLSLQAETMREANKETGKQKAEIEGLTAVVTSNNISLGTREASLKKLIAISPEYLNRLTLENIATAEGKRILDTYNKALEASANIKAANAIQERESGKDVKLRTVKQELEIFKTTKDAGGLGDDAKDALALGSGADHVTDAIRIVQAKIDAQSQNVKAATDNFVNQTKNQEDARKAFLLRDITLARQEQNNADKSTDAYKTSTQKLIAARKKFDDEFGNKKSGAGTVSDIKNPVSHDDKKTAEKAGNKAESEFERLKKQALKYQEELLKLKERAVIKGEEPEQAEIDAVAAKYTALLQQGKDFFIAHAINQKSFNADEKLIAEAQAQELKNIFDKYYKKNFEANSAKEYDDSITARHEFSDQLKTAAARDYAEGKLSKAHYEQEIKQIDKDETADRIIIAKDYSEAVKKAAKDVTDFTKQQGKQTTQDTIEEAEKRNQVTASDALAKAQRKILTARPGSDAEYNAKLDLLQLQSDQELALKEYTNEELLLMEAEFNKSVDDLGKERVQQQIDRVLEFVGAFQSALSSLNQFISNKETAQFNKEKALNDKKKKSYKDQLDNKLISKEQYDKKTTALDEELDKKDKELKRKQAQREKILKLFNAVISVAAGIASSLAYGGPVGIALAIATGIAGALQIAAIANSPLPELGLGDWIRKGDKHSDPSGGINAKIERDEAVMMAAAMNDKNVYTVTGNTAQITSALNSRAGGTNWAGGAVVQMPKWRTEPSAAINPNLPRIMEQGGIIRPLNQENNDSNGNEEVASLLRRNNQLLEQSIEVSKDKNDKLHAVVSIKEFDRTRQLYDQSKKASGLG